MLMMASFPRNRNLNSLMLTDAYNLENELAEQNSPHLLQSDLLPV